MPGTYRCFCLAAFACALAACASDPGASAPRDAAGPTPIDGVRPASGILASGAVPLALVSTAPGGTGSLVFVAAAPAAVRGAKYARIRSSRGDSVTTQAFSGGFDPLPVRGEDGDLVTVTIVDSADHEATTHLPVRAKPPRVVRTNPAPNRADVPLNIRITVVFSTPMDPEAARGVQLVRDGLELSGRASTAPDGLSIEFIPAVPLEANTTYELRVQRGVRDVLGGELVESVLAPFRTGTLASDIGPRWIQAMRTGFSPRYVELSSLLVGDSADVKLVDEWGRAIVPDPPGRWSSSAAGVLRASQTGPGTARIVASGAGTATLSIEADGRTTTTNVRVQEGIADELRSRTSVYYADYVLNSSDRVVGGVWRMRLDGRDNAQLFSVSELPADPTLGCLEPSCYEAGLQFAVSGDGRIAVTRASELAGVWVKDVVLGALRQVNTPGERGAAHSPAWSLDGRHLAYWFDFFDEATTELRVVNADGSDPRVLLRVPYDTSLVGPCAWLCFRPQGGARIVWHADGRRLLMWSATGTQQLDIDGNAMSPYMPGFLPGPWLADGRIQLVFDLTVDESGGVWPGQRTYQADAIGVVDRDAFVEGDRLDDWPTAVSPDDRLMTDGHRIWLIDRSAMCCRLYTGGSYLGFAAP